MSVNISFSATTGQVRNKTKDVTRRLGWHKLKVGQVLQPIVKGQGLKKGEHVEKIGGPIRVVSTRLGALSHLLEPSGPFAYEENEMAREGFPGMSRREFVDMFCRMNKCDTSTWVMRIEFEYL